MKETGVGAVDKSVGPVQNRVPLAGLGSGSHDSLTNRVAVTAVLVHATVVCDVLSQLGTPGRLRLPNVGEEQKPPPSDKRLTRSCCRCGHTVKIPEQMGTRGGPHLLNIVESPAPPVQSSCQCFNSSEFVVVCLEKDRPLGTGTGEEVRGN